MTPRVTVLLAVLDGGAYLREAVDSVLAQTFRDFELLIVDDASTDGSIESLPPDGRIRILRNDRNIGQIPSLNRGLREAAAPLVARLDHDDVCLPRRLERQVEVFERTPEVALVATWADIVDDGRLWTRVQPRIERYVDFAANAVTYRLNLVHPTLMFRREAVLAVGGFDERLGAAEDQELYRRLVLARREARVVPEPLVLYRRHEGQMTYAKAAMVLENDARSYERFVAELAPGAPAATLQRLLVGDPTVWRDVPVEEAMLDGFLTAAGDRLRLDDAERAHLAAAVADRIAGTAAAAWTAGAYTPAVGPALAFAARQGGRRALRLARLQPLLVATAPAGRTVAGGRRRLQQALTSEALAAPRRVLRRSRVLRDAYTRLVRASPPSG